MGWFSSEFNRKSLQPDLGDFQLQTGLTGKFENYSSEVWPTKCVNSEHCDQLL